MRFKQLYEQVHTKQYELDSGLEDELVLSGGVAGHMMRLEEVDSFTFKDFKDIIKDSIQGKLKFVSEKIDGIQMSFSVVNDRVVLARNKSHLKDQGVNAMTPDDIKIKWEGRDTGEVYLNAIEDLQSGIEKLSDKQKEKIFGNGKRWMNTEVVHPKAEGFVPYDAYQLNFHGIIEYDLDGNKVGEIKEFGSLLEKMLKQINQDEQKNFKFRSVQNVQLQPLKNLAQVKKTYLAALDKYMKKFGGKDSMTLGEMKKNWFVAEIEKVSKTIDPNAKEQLAWRLSSQEAARYKMTSLKDDVSDKKEIITLKKMAKDAKDLNEKILLKPLDSLFLKLGADILKNTKGLLALQSGSDTTKVMKDKLQAVINKTKDLKDPKSMEFLQREMDRLLAAGGMASLVPTEGIVFQHKGELIKMLGAFVPSNRIFGLRFKQG